MSHLKIRSIRCQYINVADDYDDEDGKEIKITCDDLENMKQAMDSVDELQTKVTALATKNDELQKDVAWLKDHLIKLQFHVLERPKVEAEFEGIAKMSFVPPTETPPSLVPTLPHTSFVCTMSRPSTQLSDSCVDKSACKSQVHPQQYATVSTSENAPSTDRTLGSE